MAVANTLAYYDTAAVTAVISFIVLTPGLLSVSGLTAVAQLLEHMINE
jgi:hypothetical protein